MRLWEFIKGIQLDVVELEFIPLQIKVFPQLIFITSMSNQLFIFDYHIIENKIKIQKKSEKQYPSDIEIASCNGQFYVRFVQDGKLFVDQINVKEKITVYKNFHEDLMLFFNGSGATATTFKPFDIKYLFKTCRTEGKEEFMEQKRVKVDEIKERKKQNKQNKPNKNRYRNKKQKNSQAVE